MKKAIYYKEKEACNCPYEELKSKMEDLERKVLDLENHISCHPDFVPVETNTMATKINQPIMINGEKHWVRANTIQELTNKIVALVGAPPASNKHPFDDYA